MLRSTALERWPSESRMSVILADEQSMPSSSMSFAHNEANEILMVCLFSPAFRYLHSFVHDRDAVTDAEEVLQPVRNEDYGYTTCLDLVDQCENCLNLCNCQC